MSDQAPKPMTVDETKAMSMMYFMFQGAAPDSARDMAWFLGGATFGLTLASRNGDLNMHLENIKIMVREILDQKLEAGSGG